MGVAEPMVMRNRVRYPNFVRKAVESETTWCAVVVVVDAVPYHHLDYPNSNASTPVDGCRPSQRCSRNV